MKKLLLIALLIVGCVFGDTIVFKVIGLKDKYSDVEYLGILDNKVYYLQHNVRYSINCNKVIEISNSDGKKINYDCLSNTYTPKTLTELDAMKNPKIFLGGVCITIGGYLLHTQPDDPFCISNECESLDDYKEYADKKQLQWRAGIIFISLGGILVALGI